MKKIIYLIVMCLVLQSCVKEITLPNFDESSTSKNIPSNFNFPKPPTTTTPPPTTTTKPPTTTTKPPTTSCSARQCSGTTKKNARCKNTTTNCSGRCYLH